MKSKIFGITLFIASFILMLSATSVLAVLYDGSSVSISGAQFRFNAAGDIDQFSTASSSNNVTALFYDPLGDIVASYINTAKLVVSAVDFTAGGLGNGSGGGFEIIDNGSGDTLLSGTFGDGSSLSSDANGTDFESSLIVTFFDAGLVGAEYYAPGLFSATLGNVGTLSLTRSWSTRGNATAQIDSSGGGNSIPEPASILLLGSGLLGLGVVKWMRGRRV